MLYFFRYVYLKFKICINDLKNKFDKYDYNECNI